MYKPGTPNQQADIARKDSPPLNGKTTLATLRLSDASMLAALANNKKIWDNLRDYIPFPYRESDAISFIAHTQKEKPQQTFAIKYEDRLCGVIGLVIQQDIYRRSAEMGFWLGEAFWGQGIATQAVALINRYAFGELKLVRLYSGVFDYNTASMRVLEKNGYQREGILRKAVYKNGALHDEHRFAIINRAAL